MINRQRPVYGAFASQRGRRDKAEVNMAGSDIPANTATSPKIWLRLSTANAKIKVYKSSKIPWPVRAPEFSFGSV